jgi:molybdate transport system substrate-binding protein
VSCGRSLLAGACTLAALAPAAAGCGRQGPIGGADEPLTVSAAASLAEAFGRYGEGFEGGWPRFSFAGSDELAAHVRQGARPDVYAAANTERPSALHREGLVERPVTFATNALVVAVPADSEIDALSDLERPGVDLVVGSPSVPAGAYTREVLSRLGAQRAGRILTRVRSQEPDVKGVVAKLVAGAADAGFVYRSDVVAAGGRLRALVLPERLRPRVAYAAAVVRGADRPALARRFVRGLRSSRGARILRAAGFGPAPR